jgi:hypothetical protein
MPPRDPGRHLDSSKEEFPQMAQVLIISSAKIREAISGICGKQIKINENKCMIKGKQLRQMIAYRGQAGWLIVHLLLFYRLNSIE